MKTLLWLDDIRNPHELKDGIKHWLLFSPIELPYDIVWVKSYNEFILFIKNKGLPTAICFDHDLGKEVEIKVRQLEEGKTGMDCAKFLVDYCIDNELDLPLYGIQSSNPPGKANIDGILKSYIKFKNNK
jgi:hypothetical protein